MIVGRRDGRDIGWVGLRVDLDAGEIVGRRINRDLTTGGIVGAVVDAVVGAIVCFCGGGRKLQTGFNQ